MNADCGLGDNRNQVEKSEKQIRKPNQLLKPILLPVYPISPPPLIRVRAWPHHHGLVLLSNEFSASDICLMQSKRINLVATLGDIVCRFDRLCGWSNYLRAHTMRMIPQTGILHHPYWFRAQNLQVRSLHGMMLTEEGCRLQ